MGPVKVGTRPHEPVDEPVLFEEAEKLDTARTIIRGLIAAMVTALVGFLVYTFIQCQTNSDAMAGVRATAVAADAKADRVEAVNVQLHAAEEKLNRERFEELQKMLFRIERKLDREPAHQ